MLFIKQKHINCSNNLLFDIIHFIMIGDEIIFDEGEIHSRSKLIKS